MNRDKILDEEEIAALQEAAAVDNTAEQSGDDPFVPDEPVTKLEIPHAGKVLTPAGDRLDLILERLIRNFSSSLLKTYKSPIEIEASSGETTTFEAMRSEFDTPVSINMLRLAPLRGVVLCLLDWRLLFTAVDKYFGGPGTLPEAPLTQSVTATDQRIADSLVTLFSNDLSAAWQSELEIEVERTGAETDPRFAVIPGLGELEKLIRIRFELKFEQGAGEVQLVLPETILDQLDVLQATPIEGDGRENQAPAVAWRDALQEVEIEFCSEFPAATVSLQRLLTLKPGDVLPIEMPPVVGLAADGRLLLQGTCGDADGFRALQITNWLDA